MTVFIGKCILTMLHAVVLLVAKVYQSIVAAPAVRMNYTFRVNAPTNNALQGGSRAIWNDFSVHTALSFKQTENNGFTSGSSPSETSNPTSAKVAFINFELT